MSNFWNNIRFSINYPIIVIYIDMKNVLVSFLMCCTLMVQYHVVCGQKVVRSNGKAEIMQDPSMSAAQAKAMVLELAKVNAIENAFGTYIEQDMRSNLVDGELSFNMMGSNKVKGEWIETLGEPKTTYQMRDDDGNPEIWWTCEITGNIREYTKPKIDFEVKTLKRPDMAYESNRYQNGEDFYLSFVSATAGYLTIYVADEAETAYRILPYSTMVGEYINAVPVESDINYIFFDNKSTKPYFPNFANSKADALTMSTVKKSEFNTIYVIFSKSPFSKPILADVENKEKLIFPKSLSMDKFDLWLSANVIASNEFQFKKVRVEIWK